MMQIRGLPWIVAALCLLASSPLHAQDKGKSGLTLGTGGIGVLWHASDRVAIRPDFSFSWSTTENPVTANSDQNATSKYSSTGLGFGASGLLYFARIENLRIYLSPRVGYSRTRSTNRFVSIYTDSVMTRSTARTVSASGSLGAQYSLHKRLAVYGETGVTYSHLNATAKSTPSYQLYDVPESTQTGNAVGLRGGVGLVLYF